MGPANDNAHRALADAGAVHEGFVGQVHQVVDHEAVVALDGDQLAVASPLGIVVPVHVGHERRIRLGGIAGPDPHKAMPLDNRKRAYAG